MYFGASCCLCLCCLCSPCIRNKCKCASSLNNQLNIALLMHGNHISFTRLVVRKVNKQEFIQHLTGNEQKHYRKGNFLILMTSMAVFIKALDCTN